VNLLGSVSQEAKARTLIQRKGRDYHQINLPGEKNTKSFTWNEDFK
jgi:hypothetical protein